MGIKTKFIHCPLPLMKTEDIFHNHLPTDSTSYL